MWSILLFLEFSPNHNTKSFSGKLPLYILQHVRELLKEGLSPIITRDLTVCDILALCIAKDQTNLPKSDDWTGRKYIIL